MLSVFFGLIKLAIYWYICILLRKKPYSSKVFWSLTSRKHEKSVANLWEHEICCDTMRLITKSWDLASLSGRTKPITAHENENCDWFIVLLIPCTCNFENVVFISRMSILVVQRSGELDEMFTPLLLILQLHFHLWYLIFTRPQAPLRLIVYENQWSFHIYITLSSWSLQRAGKTARLYTHRR